MRTRNILSIALDGTVVVTVLALIAALAALLPFAAIHRRITYIACVVIALLGAIAVIYQMRRLYRLDKARTLLSILLAEGHQTVLRVGRLSPHWGEFPGLAEEDKEHYQLLADWCARVEDVLRKYAGEAYVNRLHLGGSNLQDASSMTIWKMNHRLETLASFLAELK